MGWQDIYKKKMQESGLAAGDINFVDVDTFHKREKERWASEVATGSVQTVTAPAKQEKEKYVASPYGTFLGGFSYKGNTRRQKTEQELADEAAQQAAYIKEYQRLAGLDLDSYGKQVESAKKAAQKNRTQYNVRAFGGYDANRTTDEERTYAAMQADYNKAKDIQYDIKGQEALESLTAEQSKAVETLATERSDTAKRQTAWTALQKTGLSDDEISQLVNYQRNIPKRQKNAERYAEMQDAAEAYAETNPGLATVASVPANLLSGIGTFDAAMRKLSDPDSPVDYKSGAFLPYAYSRGVRDTVTKNLESDYGKPASFAYGVGTSILDSAATVGLAALGIPAGVASATLGGAAATSAMTEAKARGLSDEKAILTGVLSGVAETALEKFSLESLIAMKLPTGTAKQRVVGALKNAAVQAGIEGSEEMFTDFANLIFDSAVNGSMSDVQQRIAVYMAGGMDYDEARKKVLGETVKDVALDFVAGGLAGGLMGGGNMAIRTAAQGAYDARVNDARTVVRQRAGVTGSYQAAEDGKTSYNGQETSVRIVVKDGKVELTTGETVDPKDVQFSDRNTADLYEGAIRTAENAGAAQVFVDSYTGGDVSAYILGMQEAYYNGKEGVPLEDAGGFAADLSDAQRRAAWEQGRAAASVPDLKDYGFGEKGTQAWNKVQENEAVRNNRRLRAGFTAMYQAGMRGESASAVKSDAAKYIPPSVQTAAYQAGLADAAESLARETAAVQFVSSAGSESGLVDNEYARKLAEEKSGTAALLSMLGKDLGVRVEIVPKVLGGNANGQYVAGRNLVQIAADADDAFAFVAAHEVTHRMQSLAPEEYRSYRDYAMRFRAQELGEEGAVALVERYRARSEEAGVTLTQEEAMDEIAANFTMQMIEDGGLFEDFARENRSEAKKLLDALKAFVQKVKSLFRSKEARDKASREAYGTDMATLEECVARWQKAYDAAGKAAQNAKTAAGEGSGEGRYQIKKIDGRLMTVIDTQNDTRDFKAAEAYLKTLVNTDHPFSTILMDAQPVYVGKDLPGEYRSSEYTKSMLSKLRDVKMQAATNLDEMLLLAENGEWRENVKPKHAKDAQNGWYRYDAEFAVPILNAKKAVDHYTVYGGTLLIRNDADGKSYLYDLLDIEKKKVISAASFSAETHSEVLPPKPSTNSISTSDGNVNAKFSLKGMDSAGRQLSEQQQEYFKDSKVRDAEGRLKPVYHGSDALFTKFSADFMSKNGSSEGQGFYFTDLKTMAQGYEKKGGQLLEGYLDIKNPLSDSKVTLTSAEVKRLIKAIDPTGDDLVLNYDSRGGMGYPSKAWYERAVNDTLRMTMESSESDSEILAELANGMGNPGAVLKAAREVLGYDGYIVEGKYDNATVYVAFDSSQFKNMDNLTPTSDPDIRFSLKGMDSAYMTAVERGEAVREVGVSVDEDTSSASPGRFSLKTWNESDYVKKRKEASEELSRALGVSVRTAKKYIDNINSVAKMIADDRVRLDYEASPGRSSFVSNSEYGGSLDFSTICKKRRLLTGTLEAIQRALPNTALTADEILSIRRMMADKGYEVSCGLCYVEGSRAKMGVYTKEFLEEYAKSGAEYVPNMAEMNTATGQERIRSEHPEVYEAYEKYMNKLAQRKPKLYQLATEYQGEIRKKFKGKGSVEEKNKNGGMRLQSFSDFEIIHLIDCMQAIMDMSEVGLAGQAYTKVPDFAWALGDTGLKINLSLIAKGVDANGNIILDETEGMTRSDAEALRKRYPKNVGTILVVFNDAQLRAAMKNDFIDFIIPFHRSQWNSAQYEALGLPQGAKDYTPWQNESYIEPVYNKTGKKQRPENYMPNEYWDYGRSGKENAEKYLRMCSENNRKPKFSFLLDKGADGAYHLKADGSTDGYWKLLIDFKMYDNVGNGSPQMPVSPKFNMEECERMLRDYTGGHAAFPVANDVVDQFVETYKESNPGVRFQLKSARELEQEVRELKKYAAYRKRGTSDREILASTADGSAQTEWERKRLSEYKDVMGRLETYERRLSENKAKLEELSFMGEKKNAKRISQLKTEITQDTNRISIVENKLGELENTSSLKTLLDREKAVIHQQEGEYLRKVEELMGGYRDLYGTMAKGERAARDIQMPKKTSENEKISQTVRTILEAKATPDEMVPTIEEMALNGEYSYEAYSDKNAISDAEEEIKRVGWAQSLSEWTNAVQKGEVSKKNTAMGWALYNNAANSGDTDTALTILSNMVEHQRSAAQALQATRILKSLSPETQLYQAQRSVDNLQTEMNKRYGDKKAPELKIDPALAEQFMQATDQETRDAVLRNIYRDIGKQMPSRFVDKWNAWRYLAMLGNARTHVRNVVGNAGFAPVVAAKNAVATGIEKAVYRLSDGKMERSKEFVFGKDGKALLKAAAQDYAKVQDVAMGGGKYSDLANANKYIEEGRVIFQSKVPGLKQVSKGLEAARKANSKALDAEDAWFSKPHYAYAMAQYCKANGITPQMIESGKGIEKAREYAIREAQKATYRDTNSFSQAISELGRTVKPGSNGTRKAVAVAMEGILPFRKTPANILVRGVEYSPIGLMNGIKQALFDVRNGTKTAAEAIDSISAGLTGTGLLGLGLFLAAQGLVRGHGSDDDDKNAYAELTGHQAYALELPDGTSITLDWLAPECLPFFIGVNLWEITDGGEEILTMSDALNAVTMVSEPLLEMSCLQSLNDVFDAVGYAKNNGISALPAALANAATSYITQALPTILGQAERAGESIRYATYTDKNSVLTSDMQYAIGRASAKIPGLDYSQIPYIDAWGRRESTGNLGKRLLNNFLNPAYVSDVSESEMEKELLRLYEATGESGVLPRRAGKSFSANKETINLTGEQYVKYAEKRGGEAYKWMTALTQNNAYRSMSDEEKADCVKYIYEAANEVAKSGIVGSSYEMKTWVKDAVGGAGVVETAIAKTKYADVSKEAVNAYKAFSGSIGEDVFLKTWDALGDITGEDYDGDGRSDAYSKIDKKLEYINGLNLTAQQKRALAIANGINEKTVDKRAPW